ncbi:MAG: tRNA (adenosine(37)-N6)-threonylcarbamoyltransferase complex dimerization subunit type 1 TsaB [Desulfobacteraceae bacterium]
MILALNTSTPQFGLALLRWDGSVLCEYSAGAHRRHFSTLMPVLDRLVRLSGRPVSALEAVVLATGPGSFTGLRVGAALAKGLVHGLGIPLVGVNSLEALALQLPMAGRPVRAILDSRKGEVFTALFQPSFAGGVKRLEEDYCLVYEKIPMLGSEGAVFIGNDYPSQARILCSILGQDVCLAPSRLWIPGASAVGQIGLTRLLNNDADDPVNLTPAYYRPPDIRPNSIPASDPLPSAL